jgi:hypothetical protein
MVPMNNEHLTGLSPDPAQITPAISQNNGSINFMGPESEIDEDILALGVKLIDVAPAIRAKLGDSAPGNQSKWLFAIGTYSQLPSAEIYQHRSFQILDLGFWWHMKEGRVMNQ